MKHFLILIAILVTNHSYANQCVPETTSVDLPDEYAHANYLRLSPNGKHLLATLGGYVGILKINYDMEEGYTVQPFLTPLKDEAYPVEPGWEFISSPYHSDDTMKYYKLSDIMTRQTEAPPVFSSYFNEFYHSIGGDENGFSVTRWSYLGTRDYVTQNNEIISESDTYTICNNLYEVPEELKPYESLLNTVHLYVTARISAIEINDEDPIEALAIQEIVEQTGVPEGSEDFDYDLLDEIYDRIFAQYLKDVALEMHKENRFSFEDYNLYVEFIDLQIEIAANEEDLDENKSPKKWYDEEGFGEFILEQPILSPNGDLIAGLYKGQVRVYSINQDKSCTEVSSLGFRTSKVSFSYKDSDFSKRLITFYYDVIEEETGYYNGSQLSVFDIESKKFYDIEKLNDYAYPNITKDGRLMYISGEKLKIVDLNSVTNGEIGGPSCLFKSKLQSISQDPDKI